MFGKSTATGLCMTGRSPASMSTIFVGTSGAERLQPPSGLASPRGRAVSRFSLWGGLFFLHLEEQERGADLGDFNARGQVDLILGEQEVINPVPHLRQAHT